MTRHVSDPRLCRNARPTHARTRSTRSTTHPLTGPTHTHPNHPHPFTSTPADTFHSLVAVWQ